MKTAIIDLQDETRKMVSRVIELVSKKELSWETLETVVEDVSSNQSNSKQVIKTLLQELKTLQSKFDKLQNEAISNNQNDDLNDEFDYENDEIKRGSFEEPLNVSIGFQEDFEFEDEEIVQGETIHDTENETIEGIIRDFTTCKTCSKTFREKYI